MSIRITGQKSTPSTALPTTVWQGGFFSAHSLARVNRELVSAILSLYPDWQVDLLAIENGDPIENADTHILQRRLLLREETRTCPAQGWKVVLRHQFPPDWSEVPATMIFIQPWEFGAVPVEWVQHIRNHPIHLWVPSTFVYECYRQSGVPESQIKVVPNGVNPEQFYPNLQPLSLDRLGMTNVPRESLQGRYKFLYVGGSIQRKGIDLLMKAYKTAFGTQSPDDVLLIVKDFGTQDIYSHQNYRKQLTEWAQDPASPPILYIPDTLPERDLPRLYTSADCLVHPYRGEGFGLPVAEAMACGLPVIVTGMGACLDFCDNNTAYLIPAQKRELAGVGQWELAGTPYWAEPSEDALIETLRSVYNRQDEARQKGATGHERITSQWTWTHAAQTAVEGLLTVAQNSSRQATYYDIGVSRLKEEDPDAAVQLFARAIELEPNNPRIYESTVNAFLQQNRWNEAEQLLERALQHFNEDQSLYAQRSWVRLYTEREKEAYKDVERLLKAGYAESNWLREVVLPLRDFFVCQANTHSKTSTPRSRYQEFRSEVRGQKSAVSSSGTARKKADLLEKHLNLHQIPIPEEPLGTRISLCMIAKDEAEFLPECLESVQGVADEIILVDTGSNDDTVVIAERYGAKVIHHPWNNDFSEARNVSLQHATGDWILWLDADERLTPRSKAVVLEGVKHPQFAAYFLEIVNILDSDKPQDAFVHRAVRMFRRLSYAKWEGHIHEQVLPNLQAYGGKVANLQGAQLLHLGYERTVMERRGKSERNIQILQKSLDEVPEDAFQQFNMANTLFSQGEFESAAELLAQACEGIHPKEDYAPMAWSQWITCLYTLQRMDEAKHTAQKAFSRGLQHPLVLFAYAQVCLLSNEPQAALEALRTAQQKAIEMGLLSPDGANLLGSSGFVGDPHIVTYKWHYAMARALLGLDKMLDAEQQVELALQMRPDYAEANYLYAELLRRRGEYEKAQQHYDASCQSAALTPQALQDSAQMWWDLQHYSRAMPYLQRLAEMQPHELAWWNRWVHCAEQSHDRRALCEAFAFLERHELPVSANVHINWGRALWELGAYDEGLQHFVSAVELEPRNANALFNAGDALYQLGAFSDAANIYSIALEHDAYNPQGWFVLGNCYFRLGVYDAARIAFQQTLKLSPGHQPAQQNLALADEMLRSTAA